MVEFEFPAVSYQDPIQAGKAQWECRFIVKIGAEPTSRDKRIKDNEWTGDSERTRDGG